MKNLILIIISFISINSFAQFDVSLGGAARSFPAFGIEAFTEVGYNKLLYGKGPGNGVLYGLIRPSLKATTSAVINNYDLKLELYPISILGIAVGHQHINSQYDGFDFYDCDEVRCKGDLKKDYAHMRMVLGYGPIVAIGMVEESRNQYTDPTGDNLPVAEFRFAIRANPKRDDNVRTQYILGYRDGDNMYAAMTEWVYFKESRQYNKMNLLAYQTKSGPSNVTYGLGSFEASDQARGIIGVIRYIYRLSPTFKLF